MNTLITNRLNGIFILNTLLELQKPVTVSELTRIINRQYEPVTAPEVLVSTDTVRRFLNDFYQITDGTDYTRFKLVCYRKGTGKQLVEDRTIDTVTNRTYVAAYIQIYSQSHTEAKLFAKPASSDRL